MAIDNGYLQLIYNKKQSDIKYDLKNIRRLAAAFGNPEKDLQFIHVTGSNGKGSVCAVLESLCIERGLRTGLFTSPHLVNYNERFRFGRKEIGDAPLKRYLGIVMKRAKSDGIDPSFFEISTLVAILYFRDMKSDIAIMEVGLGGRLDATNIITPQCSVITMIDYEHKRLLGDTKTKIATEKCGIVKKGVPFCTGEENPRIRNVILCEGARRKGIFIAEPDIDVRRQNTEGDYQRIRLKLCGKDHGELRFSLLGGHQIKNLRTALTAFIALYGPPGKGVLKRALERTSWKGRLTTISARPLIIIDGCHNTSGAVSLREELRRILKTVKGRKCLLFGMVKKKPLSRVAELLFPLFDEVNVTTFESDRARSTDSYKKHLKRYAKTYNIYNKIRDAREIVKKRLNKRDLLVVTGSLYLLGDFLKE